MPYYSSSISERTIGFLKVPQSFSLYALPSYDSKIEDIVKFENFEVKLSKTTIDVSDLYSVYNEEKKLGYCSVLDEQDGWYQIVYDKNNLKTGWIKPGNNDDFIQLRDFYTLYGKLNGLYYMKNVDYRKRGLYSGAYKNSQKIDGFTLVKSIKLHKISGNWALVTVLDYDNKPKIGYIRWREDDGTILVFPKVK